MESRRARVRPGHLLPGGGEVITLGDGTGFGHVSHHGFDRKKKKGEKRWKVEKKRRREAEIGEFRFIPLSLTPSQGDQRI